MKIGQRVKIYSKNLSDEHKYLNEETLRKLNQEAANNKKLVIQVSSNTL